MTNEMTIAGPAYCAAALPVSVKMPAPMMTPMPKTVRSRAVSFFLSWNSGSSVSLIDCSIDLVLITDMLGALPAGTSRPPGAARTTDHGSGARAWLPLERQGETGRGGAARARGSVVVGVGLVVPPVVVGAVVRPVAGRVDRDGAGVGAAVAGPQVRAAVERAPSGLLVVRLVPARVWLGEGGRRGGEVVPRPVDGVLVVVGHPEDLGTDGAVVVVRVGHPVALAQRLVLARRLHDEAAVAEQAP